MQKIVDAGVDEKASLVPLPEAREHAFVYSEYKEPRFHFYWHYHQEIELVYIRKGSGLRYIGRSVEPCKPGELILLGSNLPHTWGSGVEQKLHAEWTVIWLLPDRWGKAFWEMPEASRLSSLFEKAKCGIHFFGKGASEAGRVLGQIGKMPPYSFQRLLGVIKLFNLLLSMQYRSLNASPIPPSGFCKDNRLQTVLSQIDANSNEELSQSQLAKRVQMNPATFSRWFKQNMGRTFQRYLNEVRIARVCSKLSDGDESITSIAMESGYHNLSNFNRRFLEITGMTPKSFRAKLSDIKIKAPKRLLLKCGLHSWLDISRSNRQHNADFAQPV